MIRQIDPQMFPDRVLAGKERSREQITYDDGSSLIEPLTIAKGVAVHEGNLHGGKVSGISIALDGQEDAPRWKRRVFGDHERPVTAVSVARNDTDHASLLHARQVAHTIDNLPKECRSPLLEILWLGQIHTHREDVADAAAQVRRTKPLIALEQQPRSDEQHHRESNFKAEKNLAQSRSTLPDAERMRGFLKAFENSRA